MAFKEGARRIRTVGQITTALGWIFVSPEVRSFMPNLFATPYSLLLPVIAGLLLWALGWILEGFAAGSSLSLKSSSENSIKENQS